MNAERNISVLVALLLQWRYL